MAVTIDAAPSRVWPWLVQMGCDRAGWLRLGPPRQRWRAERRADPPRVAAFVGLGSLGINTERQRLVRGRGARPGGSLGLRGAINMRAGLPFDTFGAAPALLFKQRASVALVRRRRPNQTWLAPFGASCSCWIRSSTRALRLMLLRYRP